nr:MAG TPA: DNA-packaging protein [Bacteriophage sp.]DAQ35563.1 MAG TPA: DNA-packaging protein [Caudoviricetes sp.]
MTEAAFYDLYNKDEKLELVIARMKQDCEIDAREKFENGTIDSRLAGLWMSHYGYTTKTDTEVKSNVGVTIIDDFGDDDE